MHEKRELNARIGVNIRCARESAGLTQERFAELIDMSPQNVSDVERGVVGVSLYALTRICRALRVSSDSLLFGNLESSCTDGIAEKLSRLSPREFRIASEVLNNIIEAFYVNEKK